MEGTMSNIDVVGTERRVRKFVGFVGFALLLAAFWFAHTATDTWNAACPPGVTISDVNGAGGPECGEAMLYWLYAVVTFLVAAVVILGLDRDADHELLDRRNKVSATGTGR
jgi:hypothetical protein